MTESAIRQGIREAGDQEAPLRMAQKTTYNARTNHLRCLWTRGYTPVLRLASHAIGTVSRGDLRAF